MSAPVTCASLSHKLSLSLAFSLMRELWISALLFSFFPTTTSAHTLVLAAILASFNLSLCQRKQKELPTKFRPLPLSLPPSSITKGREPIFALPPSVLSPRLASTDEGAFFALILPSLIISVGLVIWVWVSVNMGGKELGM